MAIEMVDTPIYTSEKYGDNFFLSFFFLTMFDQVVEFFPATKTFRASGWNRCQILSTAKARSSSGTPGGGPSQSSSSPSPRGRRSMAAMALEKCKFFDLEKYSTIGPNL